MSKSSKLIKIEILKEHEAKGNMILVESDYVPHLMGPNNEHRYLVTDEQLKLLDENGIVYDVIKQ